MFLNVSSHRCGTGMSYDPNHQRCDLSKNVECQNGERPSWTPPEGCIHFHLLLIPIYLLLTI